MASQEEVKVVAATETWTSQGSRSMSFEYPCSCRNLFYAHGFTEPCPEWSPTFVPVSNKNLKWSLKHFTAPNAGAHIYFKLRVESQNVSKMDIKCTLLSSSHPSNFVGSNPSVHEYGPSDKIKVFDAGSFTVSNYSNCQSFSIRCMIELSNYTFNISTIPAEIEVPECELLQDMLRLLQEQESGDLTINVSGEELHAHKNVLKARSRVFKAMFEHEMAEKKENEVNVTDVEPEVFREMLRFVYTGQAPNLDKMADKLLAVAEKYELERLKVMCEEALRAQMTVDNAVDMLVLADLHNAKFLKKRAAHFISGSNLPEILKTEGFRTISESCSVLMAEILRTVALTEK